MLKFLERSALLRPLNFLRVKHPHGVRYNIVYPLMPAVITSVSVCVVELYFHVNFNFSKVIEPVYEMLFLLFPFYLASLAAVATFTGPKGFDEPFRMGTPVTLLIQHRGGEQEINVTARYFLSLLFGYVAIVSLFLIFILTLDQAISPTKINFLGGAVTFLKAGLVFVITFVVSQLTVLSLLAIYYLSDLIHRMELRSKN